MGHAARRLEASDTVVVYPRRFQRPRDRREEVEMEAEREERADIERDASGDEPAVSAAPSGRGRGGVWLVVGGLFLAAAVIGTGWMAYAALHGDEAPRGAAGARPSLMESAAQPAVPPPAPIAGDTPADPRFVPADAPPLGVVDAPSAAPAMDAPLHAEAATPAPNPVDSATAAGELRGAMTQRFDQVDAGLQNVRGLVELVVAELRTNPLSGEMQEKLDAADKMVTLLKTQAASKDGEIVRLRRELAERERLIADMKEENRRLAEKPALPGWEIVGLTARNAAFKDPAGHTRVVAVGEVIVDGVKLLEIDTAANRVGTTSGYMVYRSVAR